MMRSLFPMTFIVVSTVVSVTRVEATVLFDASINSTPDAQGWLFVTNPLFGAQSTQSMIGDTLLLDTRLDISEQAGYFSKVPLLSFQHPDHPTIDLNVTPFSVEFSMRQAAGSDIPDSDPLAAGQRNRGGFSLIAISEDLTGIELQFQADNIVALDDANTAFPIGESQAFDTTDILHDYQLNLTSAGYQLFADEALVLQGSLRNYSGIAPAAPNDFPYSTPSFFFIGDNTGRGEALTELTRFEVTAVPEPTSAWMLVLGLAAGGLWRRKFASPGLAP